MAPDNNLNKLSRRFFWDVDISLLNKEVNTCFIIERIVTLGDIDDFRLLARIYGKEEVKNQVQNCACLDHKTLNWLSLIFNIPQNNFKCYTKMQSNQVHWNF